MEFKDAPPRSRVSIEVQLSTENKNLISLNNELEKMQDLTKTIKCENTNLAIKEEPVAIRVKEEFLVPHSEFEELQNVFVKEELSSTLYVELEKIINVGLSVPYEDFEKFASNAYLLEGELLIPCDEFENNFNFKQNTINLEKSSTKNLQNNHKAMQECFVKLVKLPVNFETYSLRELESSVPKVTNKSNHTNSVPYRRNRKKPLYSDYNVDTIRTSQTGKRFQRCYYPDKRHLICNMCDYKTPYKYLLTRHKKIHKSANPYACLMCDFRSAQKKDYIAHQSIHIGDKPFTCNQCNFRAARKAYVTKHKFVHYSKENLFTCATCCYKTPYKDNLKRHILIHSVKKPFVCNTCGFKTAHKVVIKIHNRIHSGEKPYACKFCTHTTAHYSSLQKHMKIHTGIKPFTCNTCNYKTMLKEHLKRHFKTHSNEKPFVCDTCDFSTAHKESLKVHKNTHNKEKRTCNTCEFSTNHYSSMQRHMIKIHNAKKRFEQNVEV